MKYIITENRLNQFILDYLGDWVKRKAINRLHPFIVISQPIGEPEDDWEDIIELDQSDGRLWINRDFLRQMTDMFALSEGRMKVLIKQWFQNRFDVRVEFVE